MKENQRAIEDLLLDCEKEPIRIPGNIQPHGYLLGIDIMEFQVRYLSNNWEKLLNQPLDQLINLPVSQIIGVQQISVLKQLINRLADDLGKPVYAGELSFFGRSYHLLAHKSGKILILELEPKTPSAMPITFQWLDRYQQQLNSISLADMYQEIVHEIKKLTAYDRVMLYRFHEDMHGEVVAEAKRKDLETYLGLHYPASDIPKQARELYLTNLTRVLVNVDYEPIPVYSKEAKFLDMSYCTLRAMSPVHLQYLKNMGVAATLTISIIYQNKLWGLIACHHQQPKFIDFFTRNTCELIGRMLALYLPIKEQEQTQSVINSQKKSIAKIIQRIKEKGSFVSGLRSSEDLLQLFEKVSACAIIYDQEFYARGTDLTKQQAYWLIEKINGEHVVQAFHQLEGVFPEDQQLPADIKGALILKVLHYTDCYIIWFRNEYQRDIYWGGNPEKAVNVHENKLSPRQSFDMFIKTVAGESLPWTKADIASAELLSQNLRDEVIDLQHGLIKDYTALFELIYEQSSDALFIVNFERNLIMDCNQTALDLFEADDKAQFIGKLGLDLHQASLDEKLSAARTILEKLPKGETVNQDFLYRSLKGKPFWGRFSAKLLSGTMQKIYFVRITDITQSKEYEESLKSHNEALEKVNKELDRFVYSVSHDLRAPITSLMGLLEITKDMKDVEEILRYLKMGGKSLNRLDHFIQEILDYSRNARLELTVEPVGLNHILQEVMDNYTYIPEYEHISRQIKVDEPTLLYSDAFRLRIIFNNLISNALRYTRPGEDKPYVRIEATVDQEHVKIIIEDNGTGIREQHLDKIFDMFYRADADKAGSGLGLYIVKESLSKLAGSIAVSSQLGIGTTFTITIPNLHPAL